MSQARMIIGDTRDVVATLPDNSVDVVITSPPFLALRSYLPADHADKWREIGSEPDPAGFLDVLLDLTEEWGRVLAPHGSICVELGDTYAGQSASAVRADPTGTMKHARVHDPSIGPPIQMDHTKSVATTGPGWPLPKSLTFIPELYGASLAYGRNLLNPAHTFRPWIVRNKVAWVRPNPPVGALGDKFRPGTSYLTIATRSPSRYFDLDGVRTPVKHPDAQASHRTGKRDELDGQGSTLRLGDYDGSMSAGAPPLDWWEIPTHGYPGSHYATFPPALLTRPIIAMSPQRVCTTCGEPSRRITSEPTYTDAEGRDRTGDARSWESSGGQGNRGKNQGRTDGGTIRQTETVGWSECACPGGDTRWRPGHILDPFGGSGTTGLVATGHGRDCTLIDLDARNADLARERIGMFLEVEDRTACVPVPPQG